MNADESPPTISFGLHLGTEASAREIDPESPFRIAVIGDFSGRAQRAGDGSEHLSKLRPQMVDRDNFDEVMRQLDIRLERLLLASDQQSVSLRIEELNDFDPDVLYDNLTVFDSLRSLRGRLLDTKTFDAAAAEVMQWSSARPTTAASEPPASSDTTGSSESPPVDQLLDQILESAQLEMFSGAANIELQLDRLIGEIAAPYALPSADPRQKDLLGCVDAATQTIMLAILQHPSFKQLEANWRALHRLVFDLETNASLKIFLIDVSKAELAADLLQAEDLTQTKIHQLLVEQTVGTSGGQPWAILAGSYYFGSSDQDVTTLGRMAKIAAACGAPFVAGAEPKVVGCPEPLTTDDLDSWQEPEIDGWTTLGKLPEAWYLGLIWPRFLLRLPYGESTKPIERFAFEEIASLDDKRRLLWGNPAVLVANVLGQSFTRSGWNLDLGEVSEIDNLPVWIYEEQGESRAHPCGELWLREKALARISEIGVMPLISVLNEPAVRIGGFRSVAGTPLKGRWS